VELARPKEMVLAGSTEGHSFAYRFKNVHPFFSSFPKLCLSVSRVKGISTGGTDLFGMPGRPKWKP